MNTTTKARRTDKSQHRAECLVCSYKSRWVYDVRNARNARDRHEAVTGHSLVIR